MPVCILCNLIVKWIGTPFCTGLLQVQFLAGATGIPIQQHCEENLEEYKLQLFPCCNQRSPTPIHIMWVRMDAESELNHIVPVVAEGTYVKLILTKK